MTILPQSTYEALLAHVQNPHAGAIYGIRPIKMPMPAVLVARWGGKPYFWDSKQEVPEREWSHPYTCLFRASGLWDLLDGGTTQSEGRQLFVKIGRTVKDGRIDEGRALLEEHGYFATTPPPLQYRRGVAHHLLSEFDQETWDRLGPCYGLLDSIIPQSVRRSLSTLHCPACGREEIKSDIDTHLIEKHANDPVPAAIIMAAIKTVERLLGPRFG